MAKRLEFDIVTDASKGIAGLKQFSSAAKKAMADVSGSLDDTTTSAQKVAKALSGLATEIETEMKGAVKAADALGQALGPELAGRANVDQIVGDLHKMGLSFDEITADADTLAVSLKDLDRVQMAGPTKGLKEIEDGGKRAKGGVEEIGRSADSSKSALANMVGNSAQDLGQLGGVAGSAGVAIGQMAEYMADAALEGEGLGAVVKNFALVAAPILAIGAAIATFQEALNSVKDDEKQAEQITKDLGSAFQDTGNWVQAATKVLRDHSDAFANYTNRVTNLGEAIDQTIVGKGLSKLPVIGDHFKQVTTDVTAGLAAVGKTLDDVAKSTEGNVLFNQQLEQSLKDGLKTGKLTERQYKDIDDAIHAYQIEVKAAKEEQAKLNLTARTFADTVQAISLQTDPLQQFTDLWDQLFRAISSGNAAVGASVANTLAMLLHIPDASQVVSIAMGAMADKNAEAKKSFDDTATALENWAKQAEADFKSISIATDEAQGSIDDLAGSFSQIGVAQHALSSVFDISDASVDFLGRVAAIHDSMRSLSTFITKDLKGKIPNIFDPNDINAGPFIDKIRSLRDPIQAEVTDAFAASGPEAAKATAENYVNQLFSALKGKISKDQIRALLGFTDLEVKLHVSVDAKDKANAEKELAILTGVAGQDPWTASIALALQEGTITPQAAKVLIERELAKADVKVPSSLETPDTGKAKADADRFGADPKNAVAIGSTLGNASPASKVGSFNDAQAWADGNPVVYPSTVAPLTTQQRQRAFSLINIPGLDTGGTVPGGGGIAAERGPEIINRRYLALNPTYVPPGTRVTSGRRTERILRTRGTRGLKPYDSGGTVGGGAVTVNFNGVGAIGSRYDLMRTVQRANLDKVRLLGNRG